MSHGGDVRTVHLSVRRTARVLIHGAEGEADEVWCLLHGYRQTAGGMLRHCRDLQAPARLLLAPEGLSRFYLEPRAGEGHTRTKVGASWMTREDREQEIGDYVDYLDGVRDRFRPDLPLSVLGFSQGVHTAVRWVTMGRAAPERLVLWGSHLPPDLPEEGATRLRLAHPLILVRGVVDAVRVPSEEEREEEWLTDRAIPYEVRSHPGGHRLDGTLLGQLASRP